MKKCIAILISILMIIPCLSMAQTWGTGWDWGRKADVDGHTSRSLSLAEVTNTVIYNTGQTGAVSLVLPSGDSGRSFIAAVGTTKASDWKFTVQSGNTFFLNGSSGSMGESIINASPVTGNYMSCFTFKHTNGKHEWSCKAEAGSWAHTP